MNWTTAAWLLGAGVAFALAGLHLLIWLNNRRSWASLALALAAIGAAGHGICELLMMQADTPESWGLWLRWAHPNSFLAMSALMVFVHLYLGTGRRSLLLFTIGLRLSTLVLNFSLQPNINYRAIHSLRRIFFLGDQVSVLGDAVINPWMWVAQACYVLWFVFVADAVLRLWRRKGEDDRRRAVVVGGGNLLCIILGIGQGVLSLNRVIDLPMMASLGFLIVALAMGYETSRDLLHAEKLARDLRLTQQRLSLAASAARIVMWEWQPETDQAWASNYDRVLTDAARNQPLTFKSFSKILHPDDVAPMTRLLGQAVSQLTPFAMEYRRVQADGSYRWYAGRGNVERDPVSGAVFLRGITVDVSERRKMEDELHHQRAELAHLSRVASLGELSGSLAHEISQPLAIILSNAQAARRLLAKDPPDLPELRAIVADIINADWRAGEVIKRLRTLMKHGEPERKPLSLPDVIGEILALMRSDFLARGVSLTWNAVPQLPPILGDRIPLQQVLLNLFTNACDAMTDNAADQRRLTVDMLAEAGRVRVLIRDEGCGLPPNPERIFEPFFTTKAHGLGIGLSICRTIVQAHGGRLWAVPNPDRGATFCLELPAVTEAAA